MPSQKLLKEVELLTSENEELKLQIDGILKEKGDTTLDKACRSVNDLPRISLSPVRNLVGHFGKVVGVAWSAQTGQLLSASQDGRLIVWDALKGLKTNVLSLSVNWTMCCAFSTSGRLICSGGLDNLVSVFNVDSQDHSRPYRELEQHSGYISCTKFWKEDRLISSSGDGSCVVWDLERGDPLQIFQAHKTDVLSVDVHAASNTVVSGSCSSNILLWDPRSKEPSLSFKGHALDVNAVQFLDDGLSFASGSDDSTCRLWDIRAGRELASFNKTADASGVTSIALSKSGRVIMAAYDDATIVGWDILKSSPVCVIEGQHSNRVSSLALSPDGNALAMGSWDMSVKVFA